MKIKQFLELAIQGGWKKGIKLEVLDGAIQAKFWEDTIVAYTDKDGAYKRFNLYQILLDPLAWQAVGKVEGAGKVGREEPALSQHWVEKWAKEQMHRMIDFLADSGSLEDFIKTL